MIFRLVGGFFTGIINGLLGAGGGLLAVPVLERSGFSRKDSHANAIAVIWPITLVSASGYLLSGRVTLTDALYYLPGGIIGALIGTFLMKKISSRMLRRLFGCFMIWAGVRLLLR